MNKTFSDLKDGDKIYVLNFAVNGIPVLVKKTFSYIIHEKNTTTLLGDGYLPFYVSSNKTLHKTDTMCISPNREEIVKIYTSFLNGMITQYRKEIQKKQKYISDYLEAINQVKSIE